MKPEITPYEIAKLLPEGETYDALRDYCRTKERGIKSETKSATAELVARFRTVTVEQQRKITVTILKHRHEHDCHALVPHPLLTQMLAALHAWQADSRDVVPCQWLAVLEQGRSWTAEALRRDPRDQVSIRRVVLDHIGDVDFCCHHLCEGKFICDVEDAHAALASAVSYLRRLEDKAEVRKLSAQIDELSAMVSAYEAYRLTDQSDSFPEWSRARGERFRFHSSYYFKS